jgi:hypothetical protein
MNDQQQGNTKRDRRAYQKPSMIQVPLRPQEAVLGSCKNGASSAGPGHSACNQTAACSSSGS